MLTSACTLEPVDNESTYLQADQIHEITKKMFKSLTHTLDWREPTGWKIKTGINLEPTMNKYQNWNPNGLGRTPVSCKWSDGAIKITTPTGQATQSTMFFGVLFLL